MKKVTDESLYLINPQSTEIPDVGLGKFVLGYTSYNTPFNWKWLWWILVPIIGWFFLLLHMIIYWYRHCFKVRTVIFYENGVYSIATSRDANLKIGGTCYRYDDIIGFSDCRTRQYTNHVYSGTLVHIDWLNKDKQFGRFLTGSYRNEYEKLGEYNFDGYLAQAVIKLWSSRALELHLQEQNEKHYTSFFYIRHNAFRGDVLIEVQLSPERLEVEGQNFNPEDIDGYEFHEGLLWIYPKKGSKLKKVIIDVNNMFDKNIFIAMIRKYYGIE